MITVFPAASRHHATPAGLPEVQRPQPGLTVLVDPSRTLPLAGYLLRHDTAVALERAALPPYGYAAYGGLSVPVVLPDVAERDAGVAERALEATANAGFDALAAETYDDGGLEARLRELADEDVACLVVRTARPRRVRRLARAVGAPVLAIPPGAAPAGGPATIDAREDEHVLEAAARVLATDAVTIVGGYDPIRPDGVMRTVPVRDFRREQVESAWLATEDAALAGHELGLQVDTLVLPDPHAVLTAAEAREGIVVCADTDGWRAPALLREALAADRACLLVP